MTFANMTMDASDIEEGKKVKGSMKYSWKKMSANLSLRRDFFLARVGFGIGLTASMHFTDMLDQRVETEKCIEGEGCKTTVRKEDDDDSDGVYSILLMPMIYVAF